MKYIVFPVVLSLFFLTSCGGQSTVDVVSTPTEKTPFVVSVFRAGSSQAMTSVEKTGRITASSTLTLAAQGAGEVAKIAVKEGQSIKAGAVIATLKDTQTNYDLKLAQAENALAIQNASIETTRISLDNAVESARIAYERAKQAYETLTGKNALQYDTVVNTNEKTLKSYNETFRTYLIDAEKNMTQLLYEGDKILGISTNFEYTNDGWESYLGVRVGDSKALAVKAWNKVYTIRGTLRARIEKSKNLDTTNFASDFELIAQGYAETRAYVDAMLYMIQNNVVGAGLLQAQQDGWVLAWNGYRTQAGSSEGAYNGWRAQTVTFFDGYKNTELATKLALVSLARKLTPDEENLLNSGSSDLRVTYENTRLTLADSIKNAKLTVEQTESAYNNAMSLQSATLIQLNATKKNAEISLEQARRDYAKLRITTPVDGVISKVIASIGQSVSIGSPIAEFSGKMPQIVLDVDTSLAASLFVGDIVSVILDENTLTGVVTAVSSVSNSNLLSTVRISVGKGEKYIGQTAKIVFEPEVQSSSTGAIILPINAVNVVSEEEGEVYTLTDSGSLEKKIIKLGKVGDINIEIFGDIPKDTVIITSDMSNYDEGKNIIKVQ